MMLKLLTLALTALIVIPGGAHLFELPAKIGMAEGDYFMARWALASALLISLTLVIFFVWVFPGNQATANWTSIPGNWQELRRNWEYGRAVSSVITFVALLMTGRAIMGQTAR